MRNGSEKTYGMILIDSSGIVLAAAPIAVVVGLGSRAAEPRSSVFMM